MKSLSEQPDHPVWVLEITEGAAANCAARKQPVQIGTVSRQHKPKILILSGDDRSNAAFGRSLLLSFADLLTSGEADANLVLKSVSVHVIFDLNPSVKEEGCTSSSPVITEDDSFLRFLSKENFALVLNAGFHSEYLIGPSITGVRSMREKTTIESFKGQRVETAKCASTNPSSSSLIQSIASTINGTIALDIGLTCCANRERVPDVLTKYRTFLYRLLLSPRQGIAGVVTNPSQQPLSATIRVTATNSRRAMDASTDRLLLQNISFMPYAIH